MKRIIILLITILLIPSITAVSYTQTAADVSPGVFADGTYAFPSILVAGDDKNPYTITPAIALGDKGTTYGIYYRGNSYTFPVYVYSSNTATTYGIYSHVNKGEGIVGSTDDTESTSAAIYGSATYGAIGVYGLSGSSAPAIYGGNSDSNGIGVKADARHYGFYTDGADYGLYIPSSDSIGVYVASSDSTGGKFNGDSYGVYATSDTYGVYTSAGKTGLYARATDDDTTGSTTGNCAIYARSPDDHMSYVGCEEYGVYTSDKIKVGSCSGCDIAEHFMGENLEPGDVVVLDQTSPNHVSKTTTAYNKLAAGIISTEPTITMGLLEGVPVALSGVVPTKVIGTVHLGDLLTTSSTSGYAMACADYELCAGAIIGKAMEENTDGKGVITALVMLG